MIAQREFILGPIHDQAEESFKATGWHDYSHEVYIHAFTAEILVGRLIETQNRVQELEEALNRIRP